MAIKILRILEYTYKTDEAAAKDMENWTTSINLPLVRMKSTTLPFDAIEWEEEDR